MTELEEARATVARLEREKELDDAMNDAARAHEESGDGVDSDTYAAHNRAQEALADFRQEHYVGGMGVQVGGDAVKTGE